MHTEDMEEDDFYAIFDGMESAFGDFSQMNSTMFSMMGPMLQFMPLEHLEMIPPDQVCSFLYFGIITYLCLLCLVQSI